MKTRLFGRESVIESEQTTRRQRWGAAIGATVMSAIGIVGVVGGNQVANAMSHRHSKHPAVSAQQYAHEAAVADREMHHAMPLQRPTPDQNIGGSTIAAGLEATSLNNRETAALWGTLGFLASIGGGGVLLRTRRKHLAEVGAASFVGSDTAESLSTILDGQTAAEAAETEAMSASQSTVEPQPTHEIGAWVAPPEPKAETVPESWDGSWINDALYDMDAIFYSRRGERTTPGMALYENGQVLQSHLADRYEQQIMAGQTPAANLRTSVQLAA